MLKVKRSTNRLYKIILETSDFGCLLMQNDEENWLWHKRFGHVNFKEIELMATKQMVQGLPKISQPKDVCTGCLMAKQTRKYFPSQTSYNAKKALELVNGDLCGPVSPSTAGGNRYVFLLVYDYSRIMWAYFLKRKDETFEAFKKFRVMVEN